MARGTVFIEVLNNAQRHVLNMCTGHAQQESICWLAFSIRHNMDKKW